MKDRWLVTGAAGFIGSNLCDHLTQHGCDVVGFDNFATGKRENIERVKARSPRLLTFIEGDIRDQHAVREALRKVQVVVHLAAQGSVQKSFADVHYNNAVNVSGFLNVATAAASENARAFIYASSCAVYGENPHLPLQETHCASPMSPYAVSKLANDLYASCLANAAAKMRIIGLRFFNIFGPWQDPQGDYAAVIPRWLSILLAGQRGIIFGDGSATRDFCYVGNICELIQSVGSRGDGPAMGIYNVGTGKATSLQELYEAIVSVLAERNIAVPFEQPEYRPWRPGDIVHSLADVALARGQLGFMPRVDLLDGIRMILREQYQL